MNLKILKKSVDEVDIEFEEGTHTLLNLLRAELLADERVVIATYDAKFPTMTNPIFHLKTRDADPMEIMLLATARIIDRCEEFKSCFEAAVE